MSNIRIVMTGHGRGEVFVDGVKINKVTAVEFRASAGEGELNTLSLSFAPTHVKVEGEADVTNIGSTEREFELRQSATEG